MFMYRVAEISYVNMLTSELLDYVRQAACLELFDLFLVI